MSCSADCTRGATIVTDSLTATADQAKATPEQLRLLSKFISEGKKILKKSGVKEKLQGNPNCQKKPNKAWEQLMVFLWLATICPKDYRISPSAWIDAAWHEFILFTKEYREFCRATAGYFIDHQPRTKKNQAAMESMPQWLCHAPQVSAFIGQKSKVEVIENFWPRENSSCVSCDRSCAPSIIW